MQKDVHLASRCCRPWTHSEYHTWVSSSCYTKNTPGIDHWITEFIQRAKSNCKGIWIGHDHNRTVLQYNWPSIIKWVDTEDPKADSLGEKRDKQASRRVLEGEKHLSWKRCWIAELRVIVENCQEKFRVKYGRINLCSYKSSVWVAELVAFTASKLSNAMLKTARERHLSHRIYQ